MKKLIATILSIFYLSTSFGATLHFHYCMDQLVYWGLESQDEIKCNHCGMEMTLSEKGCCKNDQQQLKGEDDQKTTASSSNQVPLSSFASIVRFFEYKLSVPVYEIQKPHLNEGSPEKPGLSVYLRNCAFLI